MRFLLGTSFFDGGKPERMENVARWTQNALLMDRMDVNPCKVVAIAEGNARVVNFWGDVVRLSGDLGHIHQHLDKGPKSHLELTGWSASVLALAMISYINESDFIYRESDCLAFGPWVTRMYRDLGDADWIFGPKMTSAPWMACQQSLFLVRHKAIPEFVRRFLSFGGENDRGSIGENRFVKMAQFRHPSEFRPAMPAAYLSFGVDRQRPIPWDDEVFYFQQGTPDELAEAKRRNLI